ncbi:hypothetical protein MNBD_CHLOROFLEXI01-325 [hydrothermal vent metagenome]|uniref:Uncharacterized protein n=1 Tax=hydrothermal vent metagenome TaxID=652676 RepID=A0A3B0VMS4_9ZZZZ
MLHVECAPTHHKRHTAISWLHGKLRYVPALDMLWQSMLSGAVRSHRETRQVADYRIRLMLSHFCAFDFSRMEELVAYGKEETAVQIKEHQLDKKLSA